MRCRPIHRFQVATGLMAVALLTACVIPLPIGEAYRHGSRENLGAETKEFIVAGRTTREEVLLRLGQPDGAALDESWLSYGCARSKGGVLVFIYPSPAVPSFETVDYTRLVIYFDEAGVVDRTQFEQRTCQETELVTQGADVKPRPCIDVLGKDLPLVRERRARD
jgi:hypothetical protein